MLIRNRSQGSCGTAAPINHSLTVHVCLLLSWLSCCCSSSQARAPLQGPSARERCVSPSPSLPDCIPRLYQAGQERLSLHSLIHRLSSSLCTKPLPAPHLLTSQPYLSPLCLDSGSSSTVLLKGPVTSSFSALPPAVPPPVPPTAVSKLWVLRKGSLA